MDFQPTQEHLMLSNMIGKFIENDYHLKDRIFAGNSELGYNENTYKTLAELGIVGALFPEGVGGFGGTGYDISTVFEALGKGLVNEPLVDSALASGYILAATGQDALIEKLISGELKVALALIENGADYDWELPSQMAQKINGIWTISGKKTMVKYALGTDAIIVSSTTSSSEGISLFLIETGADGLNLHSFLTVDGGSASDIEFNNTPAILLGGEGQSYDLLASAIARNTLAVCAEALGIMDSIKNMTINYLRTRQQFGTVIGKFQALQHRTAQMLLEIEQAKSAVTNAANALEASTDERNRSIAAAKYSIGRIGCFVAEEAIQMHGGIGMTWEYELGHFAKRLVMIDHEWGDQDHHLMQFTTF